MRENPYDRPERLKFARDQREKHPEKPFIHYTVKVPDWVKLGKNVTLHEGVLFTQGFGFARDEKAEWLHIPHIGGVEIGDNVEVFPYTTINRGTKDNTIIEAGTKIDHHCHIGHNTRTGKNCIICAGVVLCGSCTIGDNVWIGVHSTILNGVKVASDTYIGNQSNVVEDITERGKLYYGNPARAHAAKFLPHNKIG
jgi:UDP-3-O-[3-hydroxymyristoyl] glucosamine N-acyltransferase